MVLRARGEMVAAYYDSVAARFPRGKQGFQSGWSNPKERPQLHCVWVVRREEEGRGKLPLLACFVEAAAREVHNEICSVEATE